MNCKIATNRKNTYYVSIFFTLTLFIIDSRIRILLTLCIIILSYNPNTIPTNATVFEGDINISLSSLTRIILYYIKLKKKPQPPTTSISNNQEEATNTCTK